MVVEIMNLKIMHNISKEGVGVKGKDGGKQGQVIKQA